MLELKNICVRNTLIDLNLTVDEGEFLLVIGENGAGKTTLFNTISGRVRPLEGSVFIAGKDVTNDPQYLRARYVANVFQDPRVGTVSNMTIRDNLNMAYMRGEKRTLAFSCSQDRDEFFKSRLKEIGFENRLDDLAGQLSGGQRQALSIMMALLADSKIVLLDEITAALDPENSERILKIVNSCVYKQKKTCLMITHNKDQMKKMGDRTVVLKNGKLMPA